MTVAVGARSRSNGVKREGAKEQATYRQSGVRPPPDGRTKTVEVTERGQTPKPRGHCATYCSGRVCMFKTKENFNSLRHRSAEVSSRDHQQQHHRQGSGVPERCLPRSLARELLGGGGLLKRNPVWHQCRRFQRIRPIQPTPATPPRAAPSPRRRAQQRGATLTIRRAAGRPGVGSEAIGVRSYPASILPTC